MKAVYIEWVDSCSSTGNTWVLKSGVLREGRIDLCKTAGFILSEDADQITIVGSESEHTDSVAGDITIPKCAIRKRRIMRWKK